MRSSSLPAVAALAFLACCRTVSAADLSYNEHIRPILVENCFGCHGADSAGRKADLRLDQRDAAVESGAIAPGDPDSSVALDRIFSDDPDEVMPPPAVKKTLTAAQKDLLLRWIKEGAEYEPHWSFIPPERPEVPAVKDGSWAKNPIDRFILARLEREGLVPAPEADRRTLARRLALDVTGLPPEPADVEAFVADARPDAYERLVDSLLAKPEWGEHRGRHWLDYARYGDTHGIHHDNEREMWSYRQWVIGAFNQNMPFDRFTILQLAGDLVAKELDDRDDASDASRDEALDARIASGFNRCNITTNEGGAIDAEYLALYTRDRTETAATVWMGLTAGCAVCHNHKFDPLSQQEFYELSAFFNHTTQRAMDQNIPDTPPVVVVPNPEDRPRFAELEALATVARKTLDDRTAAARPEFDAWVATADAGTVAGVLPQGTPVCELPLAEGQGTITAARIRGEPASLGLAAGATWQEGPGGEPALFLDGPGGALTDAGVIEHDQPFSLAFWVRPSADRIDAPVVSRIDESQARRGWEVFLREGRVGLRLSHAWPETAIEVVCRRDLPVNAWTLVTITYDGSGKASGVKFHDEGRGRASRIDKDTLGGQPIGTDAPLRLGGEAAGQKPGAVGLAGLALRDRKLSPAEVEACSRGWDLAHLLKRPAGERAQAAGGLYDWWRKTRDEPSIAAAAELAKAQDEQKAIRTRGTVAHVMHEKDGMPMAHVLDRGEYDKPKEEVRPDTPEILPAFSESLPRNRLGFAKWLLLQDHPLTSRVTVNRFWQEVFGAGLVRTPGDFGTTGELPSHPDLLDWLAVEFRESGWDVKKLFRLMLTSAAYRQSAAATPDKLQKDAANRLLSRGPRFRMDAEMVRDQALAASGLLVRKLGGPSVKPYQPDGVWEAVAMPESDTRVYKRDEGESLYRRSVYTFWKRSAPPASLDIFNAPSRETCCVKRERTNTPLQALVTLNDPQFVEAARVLADRAVAAAADDTGRIDFLSRQVLGRPLVSEEAAIVTESLARLAALYAADPSAAEALVTVGASKPVAAERVPLAALTIVASELMNLDEALCK
jgi:hypothetical protein